MARNRTLTAEQREAVARLDALTRQYEAAEEALSNAREAVTAEIVTVLRARTLGPSDVARHSPFERQHVGRIAKEAGIPPLRQPTTGGGSADDE
jgi:hypothetical protein